MVRMVGDRPENSQNAVFVMFFQPIQAVNGGLKIDKKEGRLQEMK